jgi:hypothetical protein
MLLINTKFNILNIILVIYTNIIRISNYKPVVIILFISILIGPKIRRPNFCM